MSEGPGTSVEVCAGRDTAEGWIDNPDWVNTKTVKNWLSKHDASFDEFVEDNGVHNVYRSDTVFLWLGY